VRPRCIPSKPELLAADYAEIIRQQVGRLATPIVLAHSGSGPLLPAAARALDARRQVWLAAWVPDPEASFTEELDAHAQDAFNPQWIGKDPIGDDAVAATFLSRLRRRDARVGARDSPALPAARRPSGTDLARAGAPVDVCRCQRRPHDPARLAATHGSRPPWRRANRDPDRSLPKRLSARSAGRDPRRPRGTRLGPGCCAATTAAQSFHVPCKRI
jgi:hypothetical protein